MEQPTTQYKISPFFNFVVQTYLPNNCAVLGYTEKVRNCSRTMETERIPKLKDKRENKGKSKERGGKKMFDRGN